MAKRRSEPAFDSDADETPLPRNSLSSNGQWLFGALYAGLALVGFSFGVWAGASKPKPVEIAEVKKEPEKPAPVVAPPVVPATKPPVVMPPPPVEPPAKEKDPEPMTKEKEKDPEPTPEPKKKDPEPEPKKKELEPKKKIDAKAVAFKELEPIFRAYCNNCHGAVGKPKAGVDLRTAAAILKGNENGALVKPGDPENSPLYMSMKPPSGTMPPDGKPGPNEKELKLIHDWIASGAKPRRTVRRRR